MEGINNLAGHAQLVAGLRGVDMSSQAAHAAKVHKEEMLASLAASRSSFNYSAKSSAKPSAADRGSASPNPEAVRIKSEFRRILLQRYHTVLGAWREMDPRQHGRLAFMDFCRACRNMGYDSEARVLWEAWFVSCVRCFGTRRRPHCHVGQVSTSGNLMSKALDSNHDGFVTLWDIDAKQTDLLHSFAGALAAASGSAEAAWQQYFNNNGIGRVPVTLFIKACERLGFQGDAETVFKALNIDRMSAGVSFQDFCVLDRWFQVAPEGRWEYHALR